MPPDRIDPGSPQEWLARARGDLSLARVPLPEGGFYEDLCFHAQQAAEKAIKAVYLHHGWPFRYIHDLGELVHGLKQQGLRVPDEIEQTLVLTSYSTEARYPWFREPVTEDEYRRALSMAGQVVRWAETIIQEKKASDPMQR